MRNLFSPLGRTACGVKGGQVSIALLVVFLLFGSAAEAKAYTDPGTGALLWQSLIAGEYRLGRDDSCDVVLSDRSLAGQHALIAISADGIRIQTVDDGWV